MYTIINNTLAVHATVRHVKMIIDIMNNVLEQKKKDRFLFLKNVYENCKGSTKYMVNLAEIGAELGFNKSDSSDIAQYLIGEGLIVAKALGGGISLTHQGIKEYEQALDNPDEKTQHFLPVNVINIGTMNNSSLQQGTHHSTISQHLQQSEAGDLKELIQKIEALQASIQLSVEQQEEWASEMETLRSQQRSPKPKSVIIAEALKTIRNLAEGVAGNALAPVVIDQITRFISHI